MPDSLCRSRSRALLRRIPQKDVPACNHALLDFCRTWTAQTAHGLVTSACQDDPCWDAPSICCHGHWPLRSTQDGMGFATPPSAGTCDSRQLHRAGTNAKLGGVDPELRLNSPSRARAAAGHIQGKHVDTTVNTSPGAAVARSDFMSSCSYYP